MNHTFTPSPIDSSKCTLCKYDPIQHSESAECECCPNIGPVSEYMSMLMCIDCIEKEKSLQNANTNQVSVTNRINQMNEFLASSRKIDESIQIRTDLFNAATTSIIELKSVIESDESITNKPYALAEELTRRFTHFKQIVFEKTQEIIEAGNQQKAIQIYLNELSNKLRAEEREKLKIADINYKPESIKSIKTKSIKTNGTKKLDKVELKKYAMELGVSEFTLQMLVISKGITVETAANMLRKSINESKSLI